MFTLGEATATDQHEESVDLYETSTVLACLLRLLHHPPAPPVPLSPEKDAQQMLLSHKLPKRNYDPSTVIPFPILPLLYGLADKYAISDSITKTLDDHLLAHVHTFALPVYGFATVNGLDNVASEASQYLLPLASYTAAEVAAIPTVSAYHKVVRLQTLRVKMLRELILGEDIFPHGEYFNIQAIYKVD
ncbi:hypothetical protein C0993_012291 [Termitomyces sp. T159_Od127]|nr:hypothetical protein C0993_012291 [Termitomyces sp. T159_Od127]